MASNASTASEGSITLLELRSPMFGELCICKRMLASEVVFSYYVVFLQRCRQKWNVRGLGFLKWSNSLELRIDWSSKRPSQSIYKINEIVTFWLQWSSDIAIRSFCFVFFFASKRCKVTSEN